MRKIYFTALSLQKLKIMRILLVALLIMATAVTVRPMAEMVFNSYAENAAAKRKLPIYCVDTTEKKVSISFDAAWGADDTDKLLEILRNNDVKATFFLCGYWITKYPDEVKKIYSEGHDIGNHGNTHAHGSKISLEQNKQELQGAHDKVKSLLGIDMNLFRPPFGEYNDTVLTAAEQLGYYTVQWDIDTVETIIEVRI